MQPLITEPDVMEATPQAGVSHQYWKLIELRNPLRVIARVDDPPLIRKTLGHVDK